MFKESLAAILFILLISAISGAEVPAESVAMHPIEIPFRWTPGQIEIQVSFQGRAPIWCILDSGAEFSMLDREIATALKLGPIVKGDIGDQIENITIQTGNLTFQKQRFVLWALDNFRRQKREIRGVVGCELFERYVVTIDFQKQKVILNEPLSFQPDPRDHQIPITFAGRLPVVTTKLKIAGNLIPAKLMVDTGAQRAIVLRYPFATKHRLFDTAGEATKSETVATGQRGFAMIPVQELILDRWKFSNPATEAYASADGAGGDTSTDGLLGNDVLHHFQVTFDYSRKRMLLRFLAAEHLQY